MARPSKFTPEVQQAIVSALGAGATITDACAYAGISWDSYTRYRKRSADFADAIKKAQAQARITAIGRIRQAGNNGVWQADAWFLERSDPENWGRREKITLEGNIQLDIVNRTVKALEDAGIDATDFFQKAIARAEAKKHGDNGG